MNRISAALFRLPVRGACAVFVFVASQALPAQESDILRQFEPVSPATRIGAPEPDAERAGAGDRAAIEHGRYLVQLLGCGACHTDGALVGAPRSDLQLAGSSVGIAYSDPLAEAHPGVVYPANLTPDEETGLGNWSEDEIVRVIRSGVDRHGRQQLSVMPWPSFAAIADADARDIVSYLRSLKPVKFTVPANVRRGEQASAPFVHFGVYRSKQEPRP